MFVYLGGNKLNIPDQYVNNIKHRDRYTTQYETEFYDGRRVINTINPKYKTFPISVLLKDNLAQGRELLNDFQGSETTLQIGYYKNVESFDSGTFIKSGSGTVASGYTKHTEGSGSLYIDHSGSATMNIYRGFPTPISTEVSGEDLMICFDFDISGSVGGSDTNFSGTIKIKTDNSNLLYCNFTQADCQYKKNEWYHIAKKAMVSGSPTYTNLISGEINLSGLNLAGTDIYFDNLRFQDTQEVYIYEGYVLSKQTNEEEHWTISTESNTYSFADKNGFALDPWNFVQLFSGSGLSAVSLTNFNVPAKNSLFSGLTIIPHTPFADVPGYSGINIYNNSNQNLIYSPSGLSIISGDTLNISQLLTFSKNSVPQNFSGNLTSTFLRNSQIGVLFSAGAVLVDDYGPIVNDYTYQIQSGVDSAGFTAIHNSASGGAGMPQIDLPIAVYKNANIDLGMQIKLYSGVTLVTGGTSNTNIIQNYTQSQSFYFPYNPTLTSGVAYSIKVFFSGDSSAQVIWGRNSILSGFGYKTYYRANSGVFNYSGSLVLRTGR